MYKVRGGYLQVIGGTGISITSYVEAKDGL